MRAGASDGVLGAFSRAAAGSAGDGFTRSERLRGERLDDEQIDFVFDEIETGVAAIDAELETAAKDKPKRAPGPRKGFAPHLERIEQVIELMPWNHKT